MGIVKKQGEDTGGFLRWADERKVMALESEILTDGENGFIGMASRTNPTTIPAGYVQYAQNMRFDRGVANVRGGSKRLTDSGAVGQTIFGSGLFSDPTTGVEKVVLVGGSAIYIYNTSTTVISTVSYPGGQTVVATDVPHCIQSNNELFILRGQASGKSPLIWNGASTITVAPSGSPSGPTATFPPSDFGVYFQNRIVLKRDRDKICASDFLDNGTFDLTLNQFTINLGANDAITGFQPWQEDKFIIFQRNSVYIAYIDPNGYVTGANPGANSYVKSLTTEMGSNARRSIVNAGANIFFLSDSGVHILTPSLDLKLTGNQRPLSDPISDVIARINVASVGSAAGCIYNNRYYLAVPLDGATRNNAVLVYSMLNQAWESVDTYPAGMFIDNLLVAQYGYARRLYATNAEGGIYVLEELEMDEFAIAGGNPIIPFTIPATITATFTQHNIAGQILTRRFYFNTFFAKRFRTVQADFSMAVGDAIKVSSVMVNPDSTTEVFQFGSGTAEDYTRRVRIGQTGYGMDLLFESVTKRPVVRGFRVEATVPGGSMVSTE